MNIKIIRRGDIFLYDFGVNTGSIQNGYRPVLVVQADDFNANAPTVIVAAITSATGKRYLPSHIIIGEGFGLSKPSMVMLEQQRTVNKNELIEFIGHIDSNNINRKIHNGLMNTLMNGLMLMELKTILVEFAMNKICNSRIYSYHNNLEVLYLDKKSISVPEMRRILGLGKTESYWLIKKGYFKTIMLFGKIRVMTDSFEEWYANQFHYKKTDGTPPGQNWRHTMSIRETADILGIAPTTVYSLIGKDLFTVLTVSGKKRIEKKSFEEWYANQSKYHNGDKEVIDDV